MEHSKPPLTDTILSELRAIHERAESVPRAGRWTEDILRDIGTDTLAEAIRADQQLVEFTGGYFRADGTGASALSLNALVSWLVFRTLEIGADKTFEDLARYVTGKTMPVRFALGVRGVAVSTSFEVTDGVLLAPPSDDIRGFGPRDDGQRSTAVLTLTVAFPKLVSSQIDDSKFARSESTQRQAYERLSLARLIVALSLDSVVMESVRTAGPAESVPPAGGRGASTSWVPAGVQPTQLTPEHILQIKSLAGLVQRLDKSVRDRLAVAMQRWHDSRLHYSATPNLFIDVGIGLESVFLSEDSTSELKYRIAVRGGRLLGGTSVASRIRMSKVLGTLYDARSSAAHRGMLLPERKIPKGVAENVEHLAMIGPVVLRNSILAMLHRGRDAWDELTFS